MPKLTSDQFKKWSSVLPCGWKLDAQHYIFWGEKEIFTDGPENDKGVFYRLTLEYTAETEDAGYYRRETGRQIPTVTINRYTPRISSELFSVVQVMREAAGEPVNKRNYNVLVKLAASLDTADYFKRAAEKDTGKAYNDFSDFCGIITNAAETAEAADDDSDSAETTQEATQGAEKEQDAADQAEDTTEAEHAAEAQESAENMPPYKCAEDLKAAFIADGWSANIEIREATPEEIEKSGHYINNAAANGNKFYIMVGNGNMYDDSGRIVYYNIPVNTEETTDDAPTMEESAEAVTLAAPEAGCVLDNNGDIVTEDHADEDAHTATETATDTTMEETKGNAAPDMFATLAAAYFSGKTVKSKPRTTTTKTADQAKPADTAEQDHDAETETAAEKKPYMIGWQNNSNDSFLFTEAERESLFSGIPLVRKERYNNGTYFSVPYSERVRMVYRVHSYDERDNINPGKDASFCGFMIDGNIYSSDIRNIDAKYTQDINRYLLDHVKSETDAAHVAANITDEYEKQRLEEQKDHNYYEEAKRLFFERKKPELVLYYSTRSDPHNYDDIIAYLLDPEKAVEAAALRYMCEKPQNIYSAYIWYNRLSATLDTISSDSGNKEHKLRRIADSIGEQKTVRILLANGNEVKVEANAVKRIPYNGYISEWYVNASDRQLMQKDDNDRRKEIQAEDIIEISHGGRLLYSA